MVVALIQKLTLAVLAHPKRAAFVAIAITLAGAALATRIRFADDVRALVSEGEPAIAQQLDALSEFTSVDQLMIHLEAQGRPEELEPAAQALVRGLLASDAFTAARYEVEPARQLDLVETLLPRRFLLDPREPADLFGDEALRATLTRTRETMLAPEGIMQKQYLLRDPLGSMRADLEQLSTAPGLTKLDAASGRFYSKDGQSLLVMTTPAGNPFGGHASAHVMEVVARASAEVKAVAPHVIVRPIGAHRYSHDAEQMVQDNVNTSVFGSLAGVLVIFMLFFLRPQLITVAVPPLLFGASVAAGVAGLLGEPVHGIVLAFAAACLGLSTDATIHLVSTTAACGRITKEALPIAARRIGPSLSLVMTTTVAGLLALYFSRFGALRQMGILSMAAVFASFIGTLLWVPIILPLVAKTTPKPPFLRGPWTWAVDLSTRRPWVVVGVAVAIALSMAVLARNVRIDGDLRHLDTRTDEGEADLEAFSRAFGDPTGIALMLVTARDLDSALGAADGVMHELRALGITHVLSPTILAPPRSVLASRRARWCQRDFGHELDVAATAAGFRPGAFASFESDLAHLCSPAGEALLDPAPGVRAFEGLLERRVLRPGPDGGVRLAVAFETDEAGIAAAGKKLEGRPAVALIHRSELNARVVKVVAGDLPRLAGISFLLVALLLILSFKDVAHPLRALAPCLLAVVTTLGVLAATDTPINLMNLVVFPLLAGVGIDYGILMADADRDPDEGTPHERAFSLSVAALTTITDFGSFAIARYYALATIGRSVILAVFASALFALFLSPALTAIARRRVTRPRIAEPGAHEA